MLKNFLERVSKLRLLFTSDSQSRNQKRRAYDVVKTRLSESEAEADEPNQSQSVRTYIVIGLSFCFCFRLRQSGFHYIISGVGRNGNVLILLTPIPARL